MAATWHKTCFNRNVPRDLLSPVPLGILILACAATPFCAISGDEPASRDGFLARVIFAARKRDATVQEVRSIRRYILHNARWSSDPVANVLVSIHPDGRKQYQIIDSTAKGLQKEVFRRILEGEVEASKDPADTDLSPANYDFTRAGTRVIDGRECETLELKPKRRTRYLVDGWACVDLKDLAVVHLEGRTAKSVSFWIGKPYVTQTFRKVAGQYWYSSSTRSVADVKFLGQTELRIDYVDYSILPKNGPVLVACGGPVCSPRLTD